MTPTSYPTSESARPLAWFYSAPWPDLSPPLTRQDKCDVGERHSPAGATLVGVEGRYDAFAGHDPLSNRRQDGQRSPNPMHLWGPVGEAGRTFGRFGTRPVVVIQLERRRQLMKALESI